MKAELRIFINEDNESGTVILELENMVRVLHLNKETNEDGDEYFKCVINGD